MFLRHLTSSPAPRHAKRSRTGPLLAAGGLAVAFAVADGAALTSAASAATASDFARLRGCESGGDYRAATGNGFYGAYQFDLGTWQGLGYGGRPSDASPATQDAAARRLQAARGWAPWPACSRRLGLGQITVSRSRTVLPSRPVHAGRPVARAALHTGRPAFAGHVLSIADVGTARADVAQWQRRMAERGWPISVDGEYGRQSAGVASRFATEKHLLPAKAGTVDKRLWDASWTLPVN